MKYLLVAMGGAVGASARFATVTLSQMLFAVRFPLGTLLVNVLGAFLMGFVMSLLMERVVNAEYWRLLLVVGVLGGYTTFSSFVWETWGLAASGELKLAIFNLISTNVLTILAILFGIKLGRM